MDRIEAASIFVQVAERGGFAAAARHLNRSPTAITRAIADLEARLGVRLLNRTTRTVSLTEAGQRFLAGAKRVIVDFEEIELAAAGQGQAPRGELRITAPIVFGRKHVLPVVTEFLSQFPEMRARLTLLDRPVDLVEEGFDLAVRIGSLTQASAIATRVGEVHIVVVAAPAYLRARGTPVTPDELAGHDTIGFTGMGDVTRWRFGAGAARRDVAISPRLIVSTAEAALDAAVAGQGIARVFDYQAVEALVAGTLAFVLREFEVEESPIHLVYPEGKHPPPKLRAFLDWSAPRLRKRSADIARQLAR